MSNLLDLAQLSIASAQLSEIHALNAQFQHQQNAQRQQAVLADMLFQTERRARQLSAVAAQDPLVAALFAEEWTTSIAAVTPEVFVQLEHKRLWAAATARLQALMAPLAHPSARNLAHQVRSAAAEVGALYRDFGSSQNPEAMMASLQQERDDLTARSARALKLAVPMLVASVAAPIALAILAAAGAAVLKASGTKYTVDGGCIGAVGVLLFMGLLIGGLIYGATWSDLRTKANRAVDDAARVEQAMGRVRAFYADPNRGGILTRFYAEHPAYGRPLPNVDDMPSMSTAAPAHVVERQMVERQTVVARCKYCQALTPVDSRTCQHCGAANFA